MTAPASETDSVVRRRVDRELYGFHVTAQQRAEKFMHTEEARAPILLNDNNGAASIARFTRFAQEVFGATTTELTELPAEFRRLLVGDSQWLGIVLLDGRFRGAIVNPVSGGRFAGEVIEIGLDGRTRSVGGSHNLGFVELAAALTRP